MDKATFDKFASAVALYYKYTQKTIIMRMSFPHFF